MGLRTEHLEVVAANVELDNSAITAVATLDRVEHLGDQNRLHMSMGEHKLVTLGDGVVEYSTQPGESMTLQARDALYFDGAGQRVGNS